MTASWFARNARLEDTLIAPTPRKSTLALTGADAGSQLKPMEADNVGEIILCFRACVREQCQVSYRASVWPSDHEVCKVIATNQNKEAD